MNYLERNELILKEVVQHLQTRELLTDSQIKELVWREFLPIGSFYSNVLQSTLFAGLKGIMGIHASQRAEEELAVIGIINHNLPQLASELPQFYGVLIDIRGHEVGLVMEDFSQGDKYLVPDYEHVLKDMKGAKNRRLPYEVDDLFKGRCTVDLDHLAFLVDGQRKLGDFDKIFSRREKDIERTVTQLGIGVPYHQFLDYLQRIRINLGYEVNP